MAIKKDNYIMIFMYSDGIYVSACGETLWKQMLAIPY